MCALGDGQLITWLFDPTSGSVCNKKSISLGTQPLHLTACHASNKSIAHVFAASDRPTVIYSHNKKLLFSSVNLKEVTSMCSFDSVSSPGSLALATSGELMIGTIDEIQKLHIRTVPLGEQPRRICHMASDACFGVSTIRVQEAPNGDEIEEYHFQLI